MGISHLQCTDDDPGCQGCMLHLHILAQCPLTKGSSLGQTQIPPLSELPLYPSTDWLRFTSFSKLITPKLLQNKKTSICFSKQSKLVSLSVFLVFRDKLFVFPSHLSRSVRSPVNNQNLAMDLAHQNQYMAGSIPSSRFKLLKGNNKTLAADSFKLLFLSNWQLDLINFQLLFNDLL